jgi:hypothetical protein
MRMWTEVICLRICSIAGTLSTGKWTFDFRKKRRIWLANLILHSESGLRFVQSVCQLQKWLPMWHVNIGTITNCSQRSNTCNLCNTYWNTDCMGHKACLDVGAKTDCYNLYCNLLVYLCLWIWTILLIFIWSLGNVLINNTLF